MARDDMLFRIGVEDGDFRAGIDRAKASLKGLTQEYKENERAAKQLGDTQGAQQAKVNGLKEKLDILKKNYSFLQEQEAKLGERTKSNAKIYDNLQKQLGNVKKEITGTSAAFKGQSAVLEKMIGDSSSYTTKIKELDRELKVNDDLHKSQAAILKSNSNLTQSLVKTYNGLVTSISKQNEIRGLEAKRLGEVEKNVETATSAYKKQEAVVKGLEATLKELNTSQNGSSNAIKKQETAIKEAKNELTKLGSAQKRANKDFDEQRVTLTKSAEKMSVYKDRLRATQSQLNKVSPYGVNKVSDAFNKAMRANDKLGAHVKTAMGNIRSNAMSAAIGIGTIGAASVKGAKLAGDLQDTYKRNYNLLITSGEKHAEVQKNINQMQADGKKLSVEYGVSQEKIAEGYQELIKRGYTSAEAVAAMKTELQGSVASGDDFNNVLGVSSQVIDAFGLRTNNTAKMTKNTKDVVNQLAYAADMTATDFQSLGKGMEYVGDSAHSAGFQLSEASSAMGILSNHGLEADKAGTGLRKVINSISGALAEQKAAQKGTASSMADLNNQIAGHKNKIAGYQEAVKNGTMSNKDAAKAIGEQQDAIDKLEGKIQGIKSGGTNDMLSKLGISRDQLVDSNGNLKSMTDIMEVINDKTKHMGTAQKNSVFNSLFGTTGQQAGIILAQNNDELGKLNDKVKKSADGQGYVADLAKRNMGTVKQELKQFQEAGNAALILIGKEMLPVIQDAAVEMVKFLDSKQGQKGLKITAKGIATLMGGIKDLVSFIANHQHVVEGFAAAFAGMWSINKIGKFIGSLKEVYSLVKKIAAVDTITSIVGGKGGKINVGGKGGKINVGGAGASSLAGGVGKISKGGKLLSAGKVLGGAAGIGSVIGAGMELTHGSFGGRIGGAAGSLGGTAAGAAAGGAIGSIVPGAGTAIGAGIGGILGGLGGAKGGRKLGDKLNPQSVKVALELDTTKATKEMKEYRKNFKTSVDQLNKRNKIKLTSDPKSNKEVQKAQQTTYAKMGKDIDKYYSKKSKTENKDLDKLVKNGVLTRKEKDKIVKHAQQKDNQSKASAKKTLSAMQKNNNRYWKQVEKVEKGSTKKLQQIEKQYGKNSKQYKKEQNKELKELQQKHNKDQQKLQKQLGQKINKETKTAGKKQEDILATLKDKKVKLSDKERSQLVRNSQKQLKTITDNANKTYKKSVKSANSKYKGTVAAADKERYENGTISRDQYNKIVKNAEKERRDSIKKAKDKKEKVVGHATTQHKKVIDAAEGERKDSIEKARKEMTGVSKHHKTMKDTVKKHADARKKHDVDAATNEKKTVVDLIRQEKDGVNKHADAQKKHHKKAVDDESNHIEKKWSSHNKNVAKSFDKNSGSLNKVLNGMDKGSGKIPLMGGYATGTQGTRTDETALVGEEGYEWAYHPNKGLHVLGANGPEIRNLQAGTSILNHNMSKQFSRMLKQMPQHKDGVSGAINKVMSLMKKGGNWVEDAADDVMDFVKKGAKAVFSSFSDKNGLTKAKKSDYSGGAFRDYSVEATDKGGSGITSWMDGIFKKFKKKYDEELDGGGKHGNPGGAGVERWRSLAKKALAANHLSTSKSMVDRILRQIATESGGNPKAIQGNIGDINNRTGNLARGLMQVIPPTFNAYKFPGHNDPFNGYDSLLAGINYAKHTYGPSLSWLGHGQGYEHGGLINQHQIAELGENGKKEMVIPLDISERSRAIPLMKTAMNEMNKNSRNSQEQVSVGNNDIDLTEVLNKIDQVVGGLGMVVQAVQTSLTDKRVTDAVNRQTRRTNNLQSQMKGL